MEFIEKWLMASLLVLAGLASSATSAAKPQQCAHVVAGTHSETGCPIVAAAAIGLGTEDAPLVVKAIPVPKSEIEMVRENEEHQGKESNDHWVLIFTGVLALFTAVLACSTILLWLETRRLRNLSAQQAEDTKQSIALTKLSADTAIALELPLFVIERTSITPGSATFSISLGNHGRTPAIITGSCLVTKLNASLPPKPRYPMSNVEKVAISRIVEPAHEFEVTQPSSVSETDWKLVLDGKTILWVYGYLEYIDFLKKKRRTGFCVAFLPRPDVMYPAMTTSKGDWVQEGPPDYSYDTLISKIETGA